MSELWINFLQKEAAARETGGSGLDTPTSPSGPGTGVMTAGSGYGGSAPTTPSGKR